MDNSKLTKRQPIDIITHQNKQIKSLRKNQNRIVNPHESKLKIKWNI